MSETLDSLLVKVNATIASWDSVKERHHITDEIIEEGNQILAEERKLAALKRSESGNDN